MTIINTSPNKLIQIGYEGEDKVTILRFSYSEKWLENGEGIFTVRVLRNGENQAYNAQLIEDNRENYTIDMTVTDVELSKKGYGEMQLVYTGADFVKKSPVYKYYVSRSVDDAVDPPDGDVYTQIIESLADLRVDFNELSDMVSEVNDDIGDLAELTTTNKLNIVESINEVNAKSFVSVDDELSDTSTNPVQNKVITARITSAESAIASAQTAIQGKADIQTVSALSDAVNGLDGDIQGLQTAVQSKADTSTVTALSGTVSGLQTAVQSKADAQTVTALSGTVTGLQTSKADKTYVDVQLDGKASTQTVSDLVDDVYDIYPTDTASGVIANFPDGANSVPVKSLTVAIEPVQDLHGYDSPWPAGGGVNKADLTGATAYSDGTYGMYVTVDGEEITLAGTWTNSSVTGIWRFLRVPNIPSDLNVVAFENTSGNHVKDIRQDGTNNRLIITVTNMVNGQAYTIKFEIVAYEGSTAPTEWTPYSNICPITGWTGANVTVNEDVLGITFPTEAGTVYGGTLDVTNGTLTVDRASVTYDGDETFGDYGIGSDNYCVVSYPQNKAVGYKKSICDRLPNVVAAFSKTEYGIYGDHPTLINTYFRMPNPNITTKAEFLEWLAENPLHLVYELATPITYTLTPQEVSTLLGQNNIWADAGDTTVEYRANTSAYIAKKIAEAISALS